MPTALFIILPFQSHYNVVFGLAKSLQKQGFSIISARQLRGNACDLQKKQKTRYVFSAFLFLN